MSNEILKAFQGLNSEIVGIAALAKGIGDRTLDMREITEKILNVRERLMQMLPQAGTEYLRDFQFTMLQLQLIDDIVRDYLNLERWKDFGFFPRESEERTTASTQ